MQCVRAFARMHVSPMTTAALYIINRVKASQPRDSKMSEGGGEVCCSLCSGVLLHQGADRSTSLPLVADGGGVCVCWSVPSKSAGVGQFNHINRAHSHNIMPS